MLQDPRIVAYYAFIVRYWTDSYNNATTNIEQDFADYALTELDRLQGLEDTESNRALFQAENDAQAVFIALLERNNAGLAAQSDLDEALAIFAAAKSARQALLPNPTLITALLNNDALEFLGKTQRQRDQMQDDNSEQAVIVAQKIVDTTVEFRSKLEAWVLTNNTKEENDEYLGKTIITQESLYNGMGYFSDGNYGKEINRVSPEGFMYGATSFIQRLERLYWWNGGAWNRIPEAIDQAMSVQLLPSGPQEPDTVFRCVDSVGTDGQYVWRYFFWDAETEGWSEMFWFATIEGGKGMLPLTGYQKGEGHKVIEPDVQVMWDGEDWRRLRISSFLDDVGIISTVELYGKKLASLSPPVELIYMSPTELSLRPVNSDFEYTTVNGMTIDSSKRVSVYSFSPVLDWWDETESFSTSLLQHSTEETPEEYYVYLTNKDDCFNINTYDYRGRLFCSKTVHTNSRLGKFGTSAYNAIYIGKCQTAVPANPSDRVEFLNELDVSAISRVADLKETFREFADFDLIYIDEETLQLKRTNGTAGQIFVGGRLYFLGESINLDIADARIVVDGNGLVSFDYDEIAADEYYCVYLAPDSDIYNDNELNPATNKPWHPEDTDAGDGVVGPYYANKDLRLKMFLSAKLPEESRLGETWQTYWCRHIGQVETDAVKKLKYSASISSIRQMVLNPTFFDGLAEIMLKPVSTSEFRIVKAAGTSGICIVGGKGVQTYETTSTSPMVHKVFRTDKVYAYTGSQTTPLVNSGTYLYQYTTTFAYLYLTNDNPIWNSVFTEQGRDRNSGTGCLILATNAPTDAYLSKSFPGNMARWICTIGMDGSGYFSGSFIAENLKQPGGNAAVPTGTILDFAGPTCPNGFLVCNGAYYYPSQYPNLWAAIGGYWGWDPATEKFAVPNLNYACTIGTGYWGLGSRVGEINHMLSVAEMPAHQHYQDHQHYVEHQHYTNHSHYVDHTHNTNHSHPVSVPQHVHNHNHGGATGQRVLPTGATGAAGAIETDKVDTVHADVTGWANYGHNHSISAEATGVTWSQGGQTNDTDAVSAGMNGRQHTDQTNALSGGMTTRAMTDAMNQYATGTSTGGGATHNNMQPSAVVLKIIRY